MTEIPFIPSWIYTFLIIPIVLAFQKHFSLASRVSVLESKKESVEKRLDNLCCSTNDLKDEVHEMIGRLDEHLRRR